MIVKKGKKWCVKAMSGRSMGCYNTKSEAIKRLKQIEFWKRIKNDNKRGNR